MCLCLINVRLSINKACALVATKDIESTRADVYRSSREFLTLTVPHSTGIDNFVLSKLLDTTSTLKECVCQSVTLVALLTNSTEPALHVTEDTCSETISVFWATRSAKQQTAVEHALLASRVICSATATACPFLS